MLDKHFCETINCLTNITLWVMNLINIFKFFINKIPYGIRPDYSFIFGTGKNILMQINFISDKFVSKWRNKRFFFSRNSNKYFFWSD